MNVGDRRRERDRSNSPGRRGEREGSAERRAKIEAWNRDREDTKDRGGGGEAPPVVPGAGY